MKSLKERFIIAVIEEAVHRFGHGRRVRVLDIGCGTARYVPSLLSRFSDVEYVGIEPIEISYKVALKNLEDVTNAKVYFQLGYEKISNETENSFDVVFSLSVLEHVKHLDRFLALGAKYIKSGGLVVHRYDLGHALHTHSFKEWVHVKLGNYIPWILPERQFVRYVPINEVRVDYEALAIRPYKTTYHQMPNHKEFEKYIKGINSDAIKELFDWEMKHQESIAKIPQKDRERLFPAIAVWGIKQ